MADDSELDYLRTFLGYACLNSTVKHFSEAKKISAINDTRRILLHPGELFSVDGKFYKKRYKISISDDSEAHLTETFNLIIEGIDNLKKGQVSELDCSGDYLSKSIDVSNEGTNASGVCWDGNRFWVVDNTTKIVSQYTTAGFTGASFDVSDETNTPICISWDGTSFWVTSSGDQHIYQYNNRGVYQSNYIDVSGEDTDPADVTFDGTYYWVTGTQTNNIFKYNAAGVYQTVSFSVNAEDIYPNGILWDGYYFWVAGCQNDKVYKYNAAGVYQTVFFSIGAQDGDPFDIAYDNTFFWVIGNATSAIYKYGADYHKPNTLCHINIAYGNLAKEIGTNKRWSQDLFLDVEWCIE